MLSITRAGAPWTEAKIHIQKPLPSILSLDSVLVFLPGSITDLFLTILGPQLVIYIPSLPY